MTRSLRKPLSIAENILATKENFDFHGEALPSFIFHTRTVWSKDPETMYLPSGENATDFTTLLCPVNGPDTRLPVSASERQIVLSSEPEAMSLPSGENATDFTALVCPLKGFNKRLPVS